MWHRLNTCNLNHLDISFACIGDQGLTPGMYLSSVLHYSCNLQPHVYTAMLYHTNIVEVPIERQYMGRNAIWWGIV